MIGDYMEMKEFIITIHSDARENSINGQKIEINISKGIY